MDFSGLLVPESFGGSGLGCVEAGVVMEEIGRTLMPSPFLATAVLAASPLSLGGSAAQKSEHLPKIADGSLLAALAIDEGAKHRPLQTKMQAVRSGNGFKLNGAKAFVVDGHTADLLIVAARGRFSWSIPKPRASRPSARRWSIPTTPPESRSTMSKSMPTACSARS